MDKANDIQNHDMVAADHGHSPRIRIGHNRRGPRRHRRGGAINLKDNIRFASRRVSAPGPRVPVNATPN